MCGDSLVEMAGANSNGMLGDEAKMEGICLGDSDNAS